MKRVSITGVIIASCSLMSCAQHLYSENEERIKDKIPAREKQKGIIVKSMDIVDHRETGDSVTVYIKGIAEPERAFTDTLTFYSTGDGILSGD